MTSQQFHNDHEISHHLDALRHVIVWRITIHESDPIIIFTYSCAVDWHWHKIAWPPKKNKMSLQRSVTLHTLQLHSPRLWTNRKRIEKSLLHKSRLWKTPIWTQHTIRIHVHNTQLTHTRKINTSRQPSCNGARMRENSLCSRRASRLRKIDLYYRHKLHLHNDFTKSTYLNSS